MPTEAGNSLLLACRSQEKSLINAALEVLHAKSKCPEVELTQEDLQNDTVLQHIVHLQKQQQLQSRISDDLGDGIDVGTSDVSLSLDLAIAQFLLQHHPDASIRQQVCCCILVA